MPLIKDGQLVADPWVQLDDDAPLTPDLQPIVTLERWQAERESLRQRNAPLGIRLKSDQSPALIAEDIDHFDVIALEFPKFTDGRAYSSARLLRERYGYKGELRAVGVVLRDQFFFLLRSGFDALEVADPKVAEAWAEATSEISVVYQPTADARRPALALRRQALEQVKTAKSANKAVKAAAKAQRPTVSGGFSAGAAVAMPCVRQRAD